MSAHDRLLFAQLLVSPASVTFDQPRPAAKTPVIVAVVAAVVAIMTMSVTPTTTTTTTQVASSQR